MRILPAVAASVVVFGGLVPRPVVVAQQAPPPQVPELLAPVSTELVRVDVVVTQKSGQPRVGLSQDDFVNWQTGFHTPMQQITSCIYREGKLYGFFFGSVFVFFFNKTASN